MKPSPVLVDLDESNLDALPCCGVKNPSHPGRLEKNCWLKKYLKKGLRAKVLLTSDNRACGYMEYLPGELAWRAVDARGYMFIHCVWTFYREYQHRGVAGRMLQDCIEESRLAGMNGVAALARDSPWLAGPALYLANGFEVAATAPPDYSLMAYKFNPEAANPSFRGNPDKKLRRYRAGLTIIRSSQCPHIAKFSAEIADSARREYGLEPRIVELKSHRDAQNAPTPFAVFSIIHNGRILADHQISRTRFRSIMRKLGAG